MSKLGIPAGATHQGLYTGDFYDLSGEFCRVWIDEWKDSSYRSSVIRGRPTVVPIEFDELVSASKPIDLATVERINNLTEGVELDINERLEWQGPEDGLPPVGTVCSILHDKKLIPCQIKAIMKDSQGDHFVYQFDGAWDCTTTPVIFRKPLSPEQLAERECAKAIKQISKELAKTFSDPDEEEDCMEAARTLYKAGYRKQEGEQ